jgi:hypothetical protein
MVSPIMGITVKMSANDNMVEINATSPAFIAILFDTLAIIDVMTQAGKSPLREFTKILAKHRHKAGVS